MGFYVIYKGTLATKTKCAKCGIEMLEGQQAKCLVPMGNPYCVKCIGEILRDVDKNSDGENIRNG